MREALTASTLALVLVLPVPGEAGLLDGLFGGVFGGGPVHDEGLELREEALIAQKREDLALQADRLANEAQALEVERSQLAPACLARRDVGAHRRHRLVRQRAG